MRLSATFFLLLTLSCLFFPAFSSATSVAGPRELILRAQSSIGMAYAGVVEAEKAGGDVSQLVTDLNGALGTLDSAKRSYDAGDYDSASRYAVEAETQALAVADEARIVRDEASRRAFNLNVLIIISVIACLVALSVFYHLGLRWLADRRLRETMKLRVKEGTTE